MYSIRGDGDGSVAGKPDFSRYRYIHFRPKTDFTLPTPPCAARTKHRFIGNREAACREIASLAPEAKQFLSWLLTSAGVHPEDYRGAPLARRLQACLRCLRASSVAEAWKRLQREPERMPEAISRLLIGVTEFFRDREVFSYLGEAALPKLSAGRVGLRVWSVGCSDGAELYSVAMLLAEQGLLQGSALLGTDCRADAIDEAQRGWFAASRLETLPERLRQNYFVPKRNGGQVRDCLRRATLWRQGNALAVPPISVADWDVILCRNLAIYLEPAAMAKLWTNLARSLRVGGMLVAGKAERPETRSSLVRLAPCVFERQR